MHTYDMGLSHTCTHAQVLKIENDTFWINKNVTIAPLANNIYPGYSIADPQSQLAIKIFGASADQHGGSVEDHGGKIEHYGGNKPQHLRMDHDMLQKLAGIRHPNVVPYTRSYCRDDGKTYIFMTM